jgi:hypothetical protein
MITGGENISRTLSADIHRVLYRFADIFPASLQVTDIHSTNKTVGFPVFFRESRHVAAGLHNQHFSSAFYNIVKKAGVIAVGRENYPFSGSFEHIHPFLVPGKYL